jgi:putative peptidoglycan lipid II flippase
MFMRVLLATLVMSALLLWLLPAADNWLQFGIGTRVLWLAAAVIGGGASYFAAGWLLGLRPSQFRNN